jgi:transcriptional regulator with PAS, ATPase and Fis domain
LSGYATNCFNREILVLERECFPEQTYCSFEGRFLEDWGETGVRLMKQARNFDLQPKYEMIDKELALTYQPCKEVPPLKELVRKHPTWLPYRSQSMAKVLELAHKVAKTNTNVLLTGGTGVGKEIIANYIHAMSHRHRSKFLAINCTALPETLLESELFGHVKGSFTGSVRDKKGLLIEADKGTIFLDEIGDVPPAIQVKLLRALQERVVRPLGSNIELPIKARIITSTNRNLEQLMRDGKFRPDLFYRLNVFPIHIPDLKERRDDILAIARYILGKYCRGSQGFSPEVIRALENYHWPGNVRELENIIEYSVILAGKGKVRLEHLPPAILENDPSSGCEPIQTDWPSMEQLEKRYILRVLDYCDGKKNKAARLLGIGSNTLWRKLKKYDA